MKTFYDCVVHPMDEEECPTGQNDCNGYKYTDCCGTIYIQSFPFSKKQIENIEKEAKKTLDVFVEDITDEINKRILERIINSKNIK